MTSNTLRLSFNNKEMILKPLQDVQSSIYSFNTIKLTFPTDLLSSDTFPSLDQSILLLGVELFLLENDRPSSSKKFCIHLRKKDDAMKKEKKSKNEESILT